MVSDVTALGTHQRSAIEAGTPIVVYKMESLAAMFDSVGDVPSVADQPIELPDWFMLSQRSARIRRGGYSAAI
jgi:hypothetical protein